MAQEIEEEKNSVHNLQDGFRTRLVRGIDIFSQQSWKWFFLSLVCENTHFINATKLPVFFDIFITCTRIIYKQMTSIDTNINVSNYNEY